MAEATVSSSKSKSKSPIAGLIPAPEIPSFEMPKFEMPKFEVPSAFRDMAEKGIVQAKDSYEKMKAAAEEATDLLEDTYTTATEGANAYGLKLLEVARTNTNAAFDFATGLFGVKSLSEVVELSTAHARKHFDTLSEQTKELASLAQKVASDTTEPLKEGMSKAFSKAA